MNYTDISEQVEAVNARVRAAYADLPFTHPVGMVQWIHMDRIQANDYNPNSVANQEMKLLHTSISEDGYTQPVVTIIESKVDIVLPCQHLSTLDLSPAQFLRGLCWGTQRDSLMEREASVPLSVLPIENLDGGFRSASRKETTEKLSANGSGTSGESEPSIDSRDSALPTSGTSRGSEMSGTFWTHVCPTCASRENEHSKSWVESTLRLEDSIEESGLRLRWISSESTEQLSPPPTSAESSSAARPQFDSSEMPLESQHLLAVRDRSKAIIVDGFHRYTVMRKYADVRNSTQGYLPVVVIDKPIADRIASTVRHNRARGKHSVNGMGNLVFQMLMAGETDDTICNKIGLEPEELARLKHVTGYSKLYANVEYSPLIITKTQADEKRTYALAHPDEKVPDF